MQQRKEGVVTHGSCRKYLQSCMLLWSKAVLCVLGRQGLEPVSVPSMFARRVAT